MSVPSPFFLSEPPHPAPPFFEIAPHAPRRRVLAPTSTPWGGKGASGAPAAAERAFLVVAVACLWCRGRRFAGRLVKTGNMLAMCDIRKMLGRLKRGKGSVAGGLDFVDERDDCLRRSAGARRRSGAGASKTGERIELRWVAGKFDQDRW